jgi:hypothetical protein
LRGARSSHSKFKFFVGKVRYVARWNLPDNLAVHFSVGDALMDDSGRQYASSLLLKRSEFSYEKEVRLICVRQDDGHDQDLIDFSIDPEIFDRVIFDPRMSVEDYEEKRAEVIALGYPAEQISKSSIYGKTGLIFDIRRGSPANYR